MPYVVFRQKLAGAFAKSYPPLPMKCVCAACFDFYPVVSFEKFCCFYLTAACSFNLLANLYSNSDISWYSSHLRCLAHSGWLSCRAFPDYIDFLPLVAAD